MPSRAPSLSPSRPVRAALLAAAVAVVAAAALNCALRARRRAVPIAGCYESVEVRGRDLAAGTSLRMTFTGERVYVFAGGNDMAGTAVLCGDRLFWSEEASTTAGLLPQLALQDAWVSGWLNAGVHMMRRGRTLVLSSEDVVIELRRTDELI
jgi:hypothetical protein